MRKSVRLAISLPGEVLEAADREPEARGETCSGFLRHAVEAVVRRLRQRETVERYVQGYPEHPETAEEVVAADSTSTAVLAGEPWG